MEPEALWLLVTSSCFGDGDRAELPAIPARSRRWIELKVNEAHGKLCRLEWLRGEGPIAGPPLDQGHDDEMCLPAQGNVL